MDSPHRMEKMRNRLHQVLPAAELEPFFAALQELSLRPRKSIRFNSRRPNAKLFWESLGLALGDPIPWCKDGYWISLESLKRPEAELFLAAGLGYVQEASAMEVVEALGLNEDREVSVLDLCAAPGGKSSQIGERLSGDGLLVANEVDRERVRTLDALLLRQGMAESVVYSLYSRDLAEKFPEAFHRILVDAPCSSESFFAKRQEDRADVSDSEVRRCAKKQRKILADAARMLRPDGRIVYSTCTYSRDENEAVVEAFLAENPQWSLLREGRRFPHRDGVPGGYFAVLQAPGSDGQSFRRPELPRVSHGLVREGLRRWNGERDAYGEIMSANGSDAQERVQELTTEEALAFCRGNLPKELALKRDERVTFHWQRHPIGGAIGDGGKILPILPKGLRVRYGITP